MDQFIMNICCHLVSGDTFVVECVDDISDTLWRHVWLACLPSRQFWLFTELEQLEEEEPGLVSFVYFADDILVLRVDLELTVDSIDFKADSRLTESSVLAARHTIHKVFSSGFEIVVSFLRVHVLDYLCELLVVHLFVSVVLGAFQLHRLQQLLHKFVFHLRVEKTCDRLIQIIEYFLLYTIIASKGMFDNQSWQLFQNVILLRCFINSLD